MLAPESGDAKNGNARRESEIEAVRAGEARRRRPRPTLEDRYAAATPLRRT
jgi:hypothetical protein